MMDEKRGASRRTENESTWNRQERGRPAGGRTDIAFEISRMEEKDLAEVTALEAAAFSMPWSRESFLETLCRDDVLFLVARGESLPDCAGEHEKQPEDGSAPKRGDLLGYAGAYLTLDEGEITNVAVAEHARRRGVARRLLEELVVRLAKERIYRLVLEVRVSNTPAILLYESLGFEIAGTRRRFYERPVEDAYVMVCEPTVPYGKADASSLQ